MPSIMGTSWHITGDQPHNLLVMDHLQLAIQQQGFIKGELHLKLVYIIEKNKDTWSSVSWVHKHVYMHSYICKKYPKVTFFSLVLLGLFYSIKNIGIKNI